MKLKKLGWMILIPFVLVFVITGCDLLIDNLFGGGSSQTAAVSIAVSIPDSKAALGTVSEVTSVTVDVKEGGTVLVDGKALSESGGVYSATISGLPTGIVLTFIGHAYNSSSVEIFRGTYDQTLATSANAIDLALAPVDDGRPVALPRIVQIARPGEIEVSSSVNVNVSVQGEPGETIVYLFGAAPSGGNFVPSTGSAVLSASGSNTIAVSYVAPASTGSFAHTITVSNSQGNSIESGFDTDIVTAISSGGTGVALFVNATYVEYIPSDLAAEASNVEDTVESLGHAVSTFTGITGSEIATAVSGKAALLIPEQEEGDLNSALDAAARSAVANFVDSGGTLVVFYTWRNTDLLNSSFGFALSSTSGGGPYTYYSSTASGTRFDSATAPSSIPDNNATDLVWTSSLPAGAKVIYGDASGNGAVTLIPYGSGSIVILGWDWYDAAPTGTQDGGWVSVLDLAIPSSSAPSGTLLSLTTTTAGLNQHSGIMFDLTAKKAIKINRFSAHSDWASTDTVEVWYRTGGLSTTSAGWVMAGSATVTFAGFGNLVEIPVDVDLVMSAGQTYGFYVTMVAQSVEYSNYTTGMVYENADLSIDADGYGVAYQFGGTFSNRTFNGTVFYYLQ